MTTSSNGFTLVEVVLALFLIAVGVAATSPLFVVATRENAAGGDLGAIGSAAVLSMERFRAEEFGLLDNGGSLTSNVAGFFDDSQEDVLVRWTIADNAVAPLTTKIITVRALATGISIGRPKEVTLIVVRGM